MPGMLKTRPPGPAIGSGVGPVRHPVRAHAPGEVQHAGPPLMQRGRASAMCRRRQQLLAGLVRRLEPGIADPELPRGDLRDPSAAGRVGEVRHAVGAHAAGDRRPLTASSPALPRRACRPDGAGGLPPQAASSARPAAAMSHGDWLHAGSSTPGRVTSPQPAMLHGCHAGRAHTVGCGCWWPRTTRRWPAGSPRGWPGRDGRGRRARRRGGAGGRRAHRLRRDRARPRPAGRARRPGVPHPGRGRPADPDAHRGGRGRGPGGRAGAGRGRLPAQAVRLRRAGRPGAGAGAPRAVRAAGAALRGPARRPGPAPGQPRRAPAVR